MGHLETLDSTPCCLEGYPRLLLRSLEGLTACVPATGLLSQGDPGQLAAEWFIQQADSAEQRPPEPALIVGIGLVESRGDFFEPVSFLGRSLPY
jgi:hypothetical protein